jgi:hypothetical protein
VLDLLVHRAFALRFLKLRLPLLHLLMPPLFITEHALVHRLHGVPWCTGDSCVRTVGELRGMMLREDSAPLLLAVA